MPIADRSGVRIDYELSGDPDAPPLLLIRGLARSRSYWLEMTDRFAERFHVVSLDNRGVGRSEIPRPPYSTRTMAEDALAVLDHARVESAHVFGVSLGGMIGQWFAIRHPERVRRLVLGATTPGGPKAAGIPMPVLLTLLSCAGKPLDESVEKMARFVLSSRANRERPEITERFRRIALSEPASARGLFGQALAGLMHDSWRHLHRIPCPTLVLVGDDDRMIPPINSYRLVERIPNARLRVLPGVGHDFPAEIPAQTVHEVARFLEP
ncbi:MAG: alpha/beta hydrolase [Myxococcales bacterium]|nr:alpha/beta hydrolase [Myxococcales bacterium]